MNYKMHYDLLIDRARHQSRVKSSKIILDKLSDNKILTLDSLHGNSGRKNNSWKGFILSPDGIFESSILASKYYNVTDATIRNRCRSNNIKFNKWVIIPNE